MKIYFTQEALDAVKEKISKFQAGGTTAEIHPDNRSWIRREIVDPVRTWVMTRPGYETAVQTADVVSDFVPGVGEAKDLIRGNYLAAAIGLVPGVGDVSAKAVKSFKSIDELLAAKNALVRKLGETIKERNRGIKGLDLNIDDMKKQLASIEQEMVSRGRGSLKSVSGRNTPPLSDDEIRKIQEIRRSRLRQKEIQEQLTERAARQEAYYQTTPRERIKEYEGYIANLENILTKESKTPGVNPRTLANTKGQITMYKNKIQHILNNFQHLDRPMKSASGDLHPGNVDESVREIFTKIK